MLFSKSVIFPCVDAGLNLDMVDKKKRDEQDAAQKSELDKKLKASKIKKNDKRKKELTDMKTEKQAEVDLLKEKEAYLKKEGLWQYLEADHTKSRFINKKKSRVSFYLTTVSNRS